MRRLAPAAAALLLGVGGAARALADVATLTDARGVQVRLAAPAQRIVTLAPSLAELVDAAGAGNRLVGVSSYTTTPVLARRLPVVAAPGRVDLERIVSLRPDLILAWASGNPRRALDRLAGLGIAVFATEPNRLEDIAQALRTIGTLTGTEGTAEAAAKKFEGELAQLPRSRGEPRVFIEIWRTPLMTVDGRHLMSDVVRRCGGENAFPRLPALAAQVSLEQLYAAQPDFILTSSEGQAVGPVYRMLDAVRKGRIAAIEPASFSDQGVDIAAAARQVCTALANAFGTR